jgi:lipopolysaccharide transport system permease protein
VTAARPQGSDDAAAGAERPGALPRTVIRPEAGWQPVDLKELWRYRELLGFLAWRDVKVRYKQTELGVLWALIEPLLTTGVFAVLFALLMGRGNEPGVEGAPYAVSTFCAMLPWHLFAESLARSSQSLIEQQSLVTKVYFPRMILPLSAVITGLVDFAIGLAALAVMMALSGQAPAWTLLALPLFVAYVVRMGMFVSPVLFATSKLHEKLAASIPEAADWIMILYALNPMVGAIEGFRWAVLGTGELSATVLIPSLATTVVLLVGGAYFFRRMERTVADVI